MATIKVVLRTNKAKRDGTSPIAIRITKDRKTKYVFIGKYILEDDWDAKKSTVKRSHDNSGRLNAFIRKKIREIEKISDDADLAEEDISLTQIKNKAKRTGAKVSFFQLGVERIKRKHEEGVFSVSKSELSILHNVNEFMTFNTTLPISKVIEQIKHRRKQRISQTRSGQLTFEGQLSFFQQNTNLSFTEIDQRFITRYKSFCAAYLKQGTRTITNQMIFIRTLFNQAIKEKLIDNKKYPFGGEKEVIKIKSSGNKIGLNIEEVKRIEGLELTSDTSVWHAKNVWLIAFYFAGIRISDTIGLQWSDFVDGRLYYQMDKNEKPVSLKIPAQAQIILDLYLASKRNNKDFVFPFLKDADLASELEVYTKIKNARSLINKHLRRIAKLCDLNKNLSNHIARHTFGNIAGDTIHPLMLQKLYRHTDLKTTLMYQSNFIHREADNALEAVLNS